MQLATGLRSELAVGDLPRPVASYLRCDPAIVFLGTAVMKKVVTKHQVADWEPFQLLPLVVRDGIYYRDAARSNCVTVVYSHPETGKLYLTGIKSASSGAEAWVQTIYRTDERKVRSKSSPALFLYKK